MMPWTTLSPSRSSRTWASTRICPPPWWVNGTMTFRFTWGSRLIVCSLTVFPSIDTTSGKLSRSPEKFVSDMNAWWSKVP